MKINGIIERYSKDKGSICIAGTWYNADNSFKEKAKQILQSGDVRIGFIAEIEANEAGFYSSIKASNGADMSKEEFKESLKDFKNGADAKQEKFNKTELNEQTLEVFKTKAELTIALALHALDAYKNQTGKTELNEKDIMLIDSCLKATLWK